MHERMMDRTRQPSDEDMSRWIGKPLAGDWVSLRQFLVETYSIEPILNDGGKKYGWNLQYRLGGRPLCEMYPEQGSFTVLVILGKAELETAMGRLGTLGEVVRSAVADSPRYHDGCWMYIRVKDLPTSRQVVQDIEQLILIKRKPPKR